jgi:WD40 repeat protein/energy-coupling factor transporter ATP-binding protein EcfA2
MASLFVSHSSRDLPATKRVVERLAAEGFTALFIDFDPAQGIPAGRSWERELYVQLRKTDGVIFLASAASVASQWCFAEVSLARSLDRPVFPLRLEPGVQMTLLEDVQWVDLGDGEPAFSRLRSGLQRAGLDPVDSFAWDPTRAPYPGLEPFAAEDAAVFFGRDQEIDRLLELLQPTLQRGAGRFVAIVGPSGSGKSSLLRAGLLPRLQRLEERWVPLPPLLPGQQPTRNLARSLASAFARRGRERSPAEMAAYLDQGSPGLVELAMELGETSDRRPNVLVVIDQAEELLTRTGAHEQQAFLQLLDGALGNDSPVWAVATMRSEFLSSAPERAGLAEVVDDSLVIEPLSRARLPEVIERPAQRAGLEFAPGLVERMVEETNGGDALPLLAYTLRELYQRADADGRVSASDYELVGGVVGALERRANRLVDELGRRGRGQLVVPTLLKLAAVEGSNEPIRRRLRSSALGADELTVIDAFVDARLLTTGKRAGEEPTVEVAHEALLRQWPPLREAIEASRTWLQVRSELDRLAADWAQGRRDESYLVRGGRLATFEKWAGGHNDELSQLEREFLEASRALASRELESTRRSNRRLRSLAAALALLLVVAVAAGVLARQAAWRADQKALEATSRQLAAQADARLDSQPQLSMLLSVAASEAEKTPEAQGSLLNQLNAHRYVKGFLPGHRDTVQSVAFHPDGTTLASGSSDTTIALWDTARRVKLATLTGHSEGVNSVAFSPNGKTLISGGYDGQLRVWDVATRKSLGSSSVPISVIYALEFSPKGRTLAIGGAGRSSNLVLVDSDGAVHTLKGHDGDVADVAFSSDGRLLASSGWDGKIILWDVARHKPVRTLRNSTSDLNIVWTVDFSPDAKTLASGDSEGRTVLWNVARGVRLGTLGYPQFSGQVQALDFSPDGRRLAIDLDNEILLWDVSRRIPVGRPLVAHSDLVLALTFSPDGDTVVSGGNDRTITLWDVAHAGTLPGHEDSAYSVAFSPKGELLASGSTDRVLLWSVARRGIVKVLKSGFIDSLAFSRDGQTLAAGDADGKLTLWDVPSFRGSALRAHTNRVNSIAFNPDGGVLASGDGSGRIIFWDFQQRTKVAEASIEGPVHKLAFSPDGRTLVVGGGGTVTLWDATRHVRTGVLEGGVGRALAFSPDGTFLATDDENWNVILWSTADRRRAGTLTGHGKAVTAISFNPDGHTLASSSSDGTVILWDVDQRTRIGALTDHLDDVNDVTFNSDGRTLASAGNEGWVHLQRIDLGSWPDQLCRIAGRDLSPAERDQFLHDQNLRVCPSGR